MPIIVETGNGEFPLWGRTIYADDLDVLAKILGASDYGYWTNHGADQVRRSETSDRLTRRDVVGIFIEGPKGAVTVHRRNSVLGQKGEALVRTRNIDTLGDVLDALEPRTFVVPWRFQTCRVVPRTQEAHGTLRSLTRFSGHGWCVDHAAPSAAV